jgi:hypothetical protein
MADKKKPGKVLVKVRDVDDEELDKSLDNALDALFGPDEEDNEEDGKLVSKKTATIKVESAKPRKKPRQK